MTVFELQVDPERNAVIRLALAKRIVHQRELDEEEASTEEDESFLGNSITIARAGSSASPSLTGSPPKRDVNRPYALQHQNQYLQHNASSGSKHHHHHHHHHKHHRKHYDRLSTPSGESFGGGGIATVHMNVKSRWKSEYLRTTSSSPSPSGSFISAISEILPENLPENLPEVMLPSDAKNSGSVVTDVTPAGDYSMAAVSNDTTPTVITLKENQPDLVEQGILSKLEELKKEKSRLFSLFRAALLKKEEPPRPSSPNASASVSALGAGSLPSVAEEVMPSSEAKTSRDLKGDAGNAVRNNRDGKGEAVRQETPRGPSEQGEDRKMEQSRPIFKRREHERVVDRSKLNLEIPRKPSLSSASSNSTASTPTPTSTAFAIHHLQHQHPHQPPSASSSSSTVSSSAYVFKGKRQRSMSPSVPDGPAAGRQGGSGAGPFGSSLSSSLNQDSLSLSNKHPRADYVGAHGRNSNNNIINNGYNGLPEKPQARHHHHHSSSSSGGRTTGGDGYHGDDGYHRGKAGPGSGSGSMNGGSNGGPYRHNGPMGYQPPPTRIGFGNGNGHVNASGNGNGHGGNGGSGVGGRSGYYGNSNGDGMPLSKLAPLSGRGLPFSRSMMQMPHSRGLVQNRPGFGNGAIGRGGGNGGGGNHGGPPDRPISSGRPGEGWPRRRSRV